MVFANSGGPMYAIHEPCENDEKLRKTNHP